MDSKEAQIMSSMSLAPFDENRSLAENQDSNEYFVLTIGQFHLKINVITAKAFKKLQVHGDKFEIISHELKQESDILLSKIEIEELYKKLIAYGNKKVATPFLFSFTLILPSLVKLNSSHKCIISSSF